MAGFAKVRVKPASSGSGAASPRPGRSSSFVQPEGGTPITLDGTLLQESVLPPWFLKALIALIVLLIALVLIWLLLLKPTIQTAASEAVESPLASLKADVNDALGAAGLPTMGPEASSGGGGGGAVGRDALERGAERRWRRRVARPDEHARPSSSRASATPSTAGSTGRTRRSTADGTLFVTDFVFSNPNGAEGALVVLRNDTPLLQLRLENFRDYDLHFVTPIVVGPDDALNLSLSCTSPGSCDPAVFYSGYLRP